MSQIKEREAVEIRIETWKKIRRLVRVLFPNMRVMRQPLVMLDHYGDVFTVMMELQKAGHFQMFKGELRTKSKVAVETALYMLHPRVETYITTYPDSSRLCRIKQLIRPWHSLPIKVLHDIRSEVIAILSEGFPL